MAGSFTSGRFRFQVEAGDRETDLARGFHAYLEDDAFDLRLTCTGEIPDLDGAPFASWLLARLAHLTDGQLGLAGLEYVDGGGYMVEFVVYVDLEKTKGTFRQPLLFSMADLGVHVELEKPIASFQFQADMEGAAVLGHRAPDYPAEDILGALVAALLAAPTELMSREIAIIDPEWEFDSEMYTPEPNKKFRNWYGWDGFQFLGKGNVRSDFSD